MPHTVCDEAAEVSANNAMPCRALPLVELIVVRIDPGENVAS